MIPADDLAGWLDVAAKRMDQVLREAVHASGDPFLTAASTHLLDAGGKRLRPRLVLLAAQYGERNRPGVPRAAAVVELIHVASLYHDDVADAAATRRGVPSANSRWGERTAVLVGDWLAARAALLGATLGRDSVADQAHTLTRLVRGQMREAAGHDSEQHYLEVVADKTASLFALAARLGARAAGAPAATVQALGEYGEALGIAFQLADDLLDLHSPSLPDLRSGVHTLPVLRALRERGGHATQLRQLLADGPVRDPAARAAAAALLRRSSAIDSTRAEIERYTHRAEAALRSVPPNGAAEPLTDLCRSVAARGEAEAA
ncbi:polyprenyl synthetase family protein [Actinoplanes sp. NPDC026619]|uniref:polyprenyl synthetase family protein n=1 Tax=Actinoplanes sp. NPDC026619 TaxID=3155798 RepID=UPI00340E3B98